MIYIIAVLGIMGLSAALRIIPGALWPTSGTDAGYHMLLRREIRRNRMRMPSRVEAMALDERQTYPWFYHWLLACVPERWLELWPALPSAVIDALHATLVFGLAAWLAPQAQPGLDPLVAGVIAALLFSTSPALLAVGIGPRAYEITPRPLGELLFSVCLIATQAFFSGASAWALSMALLASSLLLLSSKFAVQVLLFCIPFIAVVTGQWGWLLLPLAGLAGAMLLSGGRYRWVLFGQVAHLGLYRRRLQFENPNITRLNQWKLLWVSLFATIRSRFQDRGNFKNLVRAFDNNTYFQLVLRNVLLIGILAAIAWRYLPNWNEAVQSWEGWLGAWALAPVFPFLLTSIRGWRFLGAAERYPEYGLAPACVLGAIGILMIPVQHTAVVLMIYIVLNVLFGVYIALRKQHMSRQEAKVGTRENIIHFLEKLPAATTVLPIPMQLAHQLAGCLEHRFLAGTDTIVWAQNYDRLFLKYGWLSTDLQWWYRVWGAELVVVQSSDLTYHSEISADYHLDRLHLVFDDGAFQAYSFQPQQPVFRLNEVAGEDVR